MQVLLHMNTTQLTIGTLTGTDITTTDLKTILEAVDTTELSGELTTTYNTIIDENEFEVRHGGRHPDHERNGPCPECGSQDMLVWTLISEKFYYEDKIAHGCGDSIVHETMQVQCEQCEEILYKSTDM